MTKEIKKEAIDGQVLGPEPAKASTQIIPQNQQSMPVLQGDPEQVLEFAQKAAKALVAVVSSKPKQVMINGERYLEFEDYQTIARFYGTTAGTDWTKEIIRDGKIIGYEAKALVYKDGQVISSAEASCLRDEPNWKTKPEFQLRSMAQTRACAKALRNVFAWVVVLAGYKPTPREEMDGIGSKVVEKEPFKSPEPIPVEQMVCSACNIDLAGMPRVATFSKQRFGKVLCLKCQAENRNKR